MAFEKTQTQVQEREKYSIDNPHDKAIILEFEEELKPFQEKNYVMFGHNLSGYRLYLHEKKLFSYSPKYPSGAVNWSRLEEYREAERKYQGLSDLVYRREQARKKERERLQSLPID